MRIILVFFFLIPFLSKSQDFNNKNLTGHNIKIKDLTIYYDDIGQECLKSDASYFRKIKVDKYDLPLGTVKDYYIDGTLQWEGNLLAWDRLDWSNDEMSGLCTWYHRNGNKEHEAIYKNNKIEGKSKSWYLDGQLRSESSYVGGLKNGLSRYWHENGNLQYEKNYSLDILNGLLREWYSSGQLKYEINYISGDLPERYLECSERAICRDVFYKELNTYDEPFNTKVPFEKFDNDYSIELSLDLKSAELSDSKITMYWGDQNYSNGWLLNISGGYFKITGLIEDIEFSVLDWNQIEKKYSNNIILKITQLWGRAIITIDGDEIFSKYPDDLDHYFPLYGSEFWFTTQNMLCEYLKLEEFSQNNNNDSFHSGATGTGFAINRNGYIATNYHVIEFVDEGVSVSGVNGKFEKKYKAEIIDADIENDLAILKINSTLLDIPYSINTSDNIVTQEVYAYGYPLTDLMGTSINFTSGIVNKNKGMADDIRFLQHEATLQPGNSGGPLFDRDGNVVGINTLTVNKDYEDYIGVDVENVFYSLKSKYLINLMRKNNLSFSRNNVLKGKNISYQYGHIKNYIYFIEVK
tara:strand:+ start:372 stop:2108 length:1737 start_codon:yes stop_codon:yes gene_type:complete